ncbi:MAG: hypothetical protein O3C40_17415 [Planctomycetota bacterium]|nr:hypothetical protein [Planctomycetota bacterium]
MSTTYLEPLTAARADELFRMMREVQSDDSKALALDESGFVTGVVPVDSAAETQLLGDFDVHS